MKRVLLALSGGVDSSVAAELLRRQGFDVSAVVMMMSPSHDKTVLAARECAESLGIRLYELDLRDAFKSEIIDLFASEYLKGRTPNPCVRCNPRIKFKYLLKTADNYGFDFIATGHYAEIFNDNGVYKLKRAESIDRDQSYMLAGLKQDVLSRLIFPLGKYEKSEIRQIAKELGLKSYNAPDSQENCFIPDNDYAKYIEEHYSRSPEGAFISPEGDEIGSHMGILHYTIGQRKGLGIALGRPAYVSDIDPERNAVKLSYERAVVDKVYLSDFCETFDGAVTSGGGYHCRLRSTGKLLPCVVIKTSCGGALLKLYNPTPRVSDGQAGVIYDGDIVLGGGTIENPGACPEV